MVLIKQQISDLGIESGIIALELLNDKLGEEPCSILIRGLERAGQELKDLRTDLCAARRLLGSARNVTALVSSVIASVARNRPECLGRTWEYPYSAEAINRLNKTTDSINEYLEK